MSLAGLEVFDTTIHRTNSWLKELMRVPGSESRHAAHLALRSTLHALRDRVTAHRPRGIHRPVESGERG